MQMSPQEMTILRRSFGIVQSDPATAGAAFYASLFHHAPETRQLFVADPARQAIKLIDTLRVVMNDLDNWGLLRPILEDLALRHTAYGVRPEHYAPVGTALMAMLETRLWQKVHARGRGGLTPALRGGAGHDDRGRLSAAIQGAMT